MKINKRNVRNCEKLLKIKQNPLINIKTENLKLIILQIFALNSKIGVKKGNFDRTFNAQPKSSVSKFINHTVIPKFFWARRRINKFSHKMSTLWYKKHCNHPPLDYCISSIVHVSKLCQSVYIKIIYPYFDNLVNAE